MQTTVILISCSKMSLIVMLLVQILINNHIAGCQEILNNNYNRSEKRDIFLSYLNKSSNSSSLSVKRYSSKSLIEHSDTNKNKYKNNTKNMVRSNKNFTISEYHNKNLHHQKEDINTTIIKSYTNKNYYHILSRYKSASIPTPSKVMGYPPNENEQLIKIVMEGLGLKSLPDLSKANISQYEYTTKYNEYLDRIRKRALQNKDDFKFDISNLNASSLYLQSIFHNSSDTKLFRERRATTRTQRKRNSNSTKSILLRFPLELGSDIKASDIEEANIRLLLITSPALAVYKQSKRRHNHNRQTKTNHFVNDSNKHEDRKETKQKDEIEIEKSSKKQKNNFLNMKVYQLLEPKGKTWIDAQKIEIKFDRNKMDESYSQWLQFDVTKAVEEWVVNKKENLGLEIRCDNCRRIGARIIDDISGDSDEVEEEHSNTTQKYDLAPVLNIIGRLGTHREKRSKHYHVHMTKNHKSLTNLKNNCYKVNQRCCRHSMEVVFKDIKGFEFIIQPKVFDAGYCRGRCPPRYNPAHHHALLQGLLWKQNKQKVPRPCCAPSKLVELEVLHVDEKDKEKLKISTWTDMRVLECACS